MKSLKLTEVHITIVHTYKSLELIISNFKIRT